MQVRTYRASCMNRALEQVKRELGPDAVILSNKQVAISPTECRVEVTAAVDRYQPFPAQSKPSVLRDPDIHEDLRDIKSYLSMLISSRDHLTRLQSSRPLSEVYHALLARGLDERQVFMLLNRATASLDGEADDRKRILDAFCRQLLDKVKVSRPFQHITGPDGFVPTYSFVGPTGVGKTTTLAKIAAHLKIKRGLNVGIVSVDTYRIGAVDQLGMYAEILDAPFVVAQNKTEFQQALDRFRHHDMVLIDTTGRNYLNRKHVQDLRDLFGERSRVQHLLVLSAAAKDEDLKQTVLHFRPLAVQSLIFTKIDETMNHGAVVNQLLRFSHPASYLGTGQRVPEDLEMATPKRLLSFLLPTGGRLH